MSLTPQEALPDADEVEWYSNPYRASCVQADRRRAQVAYGAGVFAVVGLGIVILVTAVPRVPSSLTSGGVVLTVLSFLVLGYVALSFTPRHESSLSWYSPIRVGFSAQGIHVTMGPASASRRHWAEKSMSFIAWDTIEGVADPISPYLRHQVTFNSAQRPPPEILSISEELVDRIKSEVEKHAYDLGPE